MTFRQCGLVVPAGPTPGHRHLIVVKHKHDVILSFWHKLRAPGTGGSTRDTDIRGSRAYPGFLFSHEPWCMRSWVCPGRGGVSLRPVREQSSVLVEVFDGATQGSFCVKNSPSEQQATTKPTRYLHRSPDPRRVRGGSGSGSGVGFARGIGRSILETSVRMKHGLPKSASRRVFRFYRHSPLRDDHLGGMLYQNSGPHHD